MKKKAISLFVATVLAVSLTACGGESGVSSNEENGPVASENSQLSAVEESEMQESEYSEAESEEEESEETQDSYVEADEFVTSATIEETVLYNDNDVVITASSIEYSNYEVSVNLLIENNSDKDLSFISGSVGYSCNSVNGYMMDTAYLNSDISAGMKANEELSFDISELQIFGINEIADICVGIEIQDEEYNAIYTGPMQILTTAAEEYDYETNTYQNSVCSGLMESLYDCTLDYYATDEIYSSGDVAILSETLITNSDGENSLMLEVANNSSDVIYAATSDIVLNGFEAYSGTWNYSAIAPGSIRIMTITFDSLIEESYMEMLGIDSVGAVSFGFTVYDEDGNYIAEEEQVSITISGDSIEGVDTSGTEIYTDDNVTMIYKGIVEDSSSYSDDIHLLILVVNQSDEVIYVDDSYDSLSVNGYMTDYYCYSTEVSAGVCALLDVELDADSLSENGVGSIDDITEIVMGFEITNEDYDTMAEPQVTIQNE